MSQPAVELKYPVGIQTFAKIREDGYVYVDKTAYIYKLIRQGQFYFLSRPRRFGKSLLLSTIEAYYKGKQYLFEGLALSTLTDTWEVHEVLHIDLNSGDYRKIEGLNEVLDSYLRRWEKEYGIDNIYHSPGLRFGAVIRRAAQISGKKVVVLVDEYDKPLLNAVDNKIYADELRTILKDFYSTLKTEDQYIEFAMLTGVARFSKVSVFSDLNNLRDISFEEQYSKLCGISDEELRSYFTEGVKQLSTKTGLTVSQTFKELKYRYDGYHFSVRSEGIYNPFSLMNVFSANRMDNYWFESGTPSYLVRLLRNGDWRLKDLSGYIVGEEVLKSSGIVTQDPIPALYQSGYLTIGSYDSEFGLVTLDYPNAEVKQGFLKYLFPYYTASIPSRTDFNIASFVRYVRNGDITNFMKHLASMVAGVPYSEKHKPSESYFQNIVYLLYALLGFYVDMEMKTSDGRIDLVVSTDDYIYIFEFKIDKTAEVAMAQIQNKRYWLPYLVSNKKIYLIGANFSTSTRQLDGWVSEEVED